MKPDAIIDALEHIAQYGVPTPEGARLLDVGTGPFLDYFEREILDDLLAQGSSTCRFFEGAYGCGKTHILYMIENLVQQRECVTLRADLSVALGFDDWRSITRHVLANLKLSKNGRTFSSLPEILQVLGSENPDRIEHLSKLKVAHSGFKRAMLTKVADEELSEDGELLLDRFLLGERIGVMQLRLHGVDGVKEPLSANNTEAVLSTVLSGLHALGAPGTILLFDETEKTLVRKSSRVSKRLMLASNLMRRLVDGCCTRELIGIAAVFAVLPGFLSDCAQNYPALGQRLQQFHEDGLTPGFRWPVLPVEAVSAVRDRETFLRDAVDRLVSLADSAELETDGLRNTLLSDGSRILESNAGRGFRRPLMKALTTQLINRL